MNNDLISREALKKAINNLYDETLDGIVKFGIEKAYKEIDNAPTVELTKLCKGCQYLKDCETCDKNARPQGEWMWIEQKNYPFCYECGRCGSESTHKAYFCEYCGAKMRKGGAE